MVIFFTFIPLLSVTVVVGVASHFMTGMPYVLGFILGLILNGVAPSILIPVMVRMIGSGQGRERKIPNTLITATIMENIVVLVIFGILFTM